MSDCWRCLNCVPDPSREHAPGHLQDGAAQPQLQQRPQDSQDPRERHFDMTYQVHHEHPLGKGTFARVVLGTVRNTGEQVAIKVISRDQLKDCSAEHLHREVKNHEKLRHRHIVRLHTWVSTEVHVMLAMDYCAGGTLAELLERSGWLDDVLARRLFSQLLQGLDFCHSLGFHHCDLKLENLMLVDAAPDAPPRLKITDFGLSSMADVGSLSRAYVGTPLYAAPEILAANAKAFDASCADVWACGVILYALLAGCFPFDADSLAGLVLRVRRSPRLDDPPKPPPIPHLWSRAPTLPRALTCPHAPRAGQAGARRRSSAAR